MKKYLLLLPLAMFFTTLANGQGKVNNIPPAVVYGERTMKEIGVQQTKLDSLQLKENIALSMADVLTFNSSIFVKNYGRATLSTVAFRGSSSELSMMM